MQNDIVILEDSLLAAYRALLFPCDPAIMLLGIYPNELKLLSSPKIGGNQVVLQQVNG
jgi:hypothetical protein